jgi:hypothetical protein
MEQRLLWLGAVFMSSEPKSSGGKPIVDLPAVPAGAVPKRF